MEERGFSSPKVTGSIPVGVFHARVPVTYGYRRVPKWSNGADLRSVGRAYAGSNPVAPTWKSRISIFCVVFLECFIKIMSFSNVNHSNDPYGPPPPPLAVRREIARRTRYRSRPRPIRQPFREDAVRLYDSSHPQGVRGVRGVRRYRSSFDDLDYDLDTDTIVRPYRRRRVQSFPETRAIIPPPIRPPRLRRQNAMLGDDMPPPGPPRLFRQ